MPRIIPEPRYFSMPSIVVGAVALRNEALNWTPWVRSLIQLPLAWTNSPAEIIAAWPRTVIRSRWPRALTRSTQNPLSSLWKVTHSTRPAKTSVWDCAFGKGCIGIERGLLRRADVQRVIRLTSDGRQLCSASVGILRCEAKSLTGSRFARRLVNAQRSAAPGNTDEESRPRS